MGDVHDVMPWAGKVTHIKKTMPNDSRVLVPGGAIGAIGAGIIVATGTTWQFRSALTCSTGQHDCGVGDRRWCIGGSGKIFLER